MLKQVVKYTDYNGEDASETLYFNLTRTEIIDMEDLRPRLTAWLSSVNGPERELTESETRELLAIIKILIELSYGERSSDGKKFAKSSELFREFKQTAVYDEFVFGLFNEPAKAVSFLVGILPKEIIAEMDSNNTSETPDAKVVELPAAKDDTPPWISEGRAPTATEIRGTTPEQLAEAFRRRNTPVVTEPADPVE